MKRIHWLLTGLSLTIVLLSINRLTPITGGYLQPYEFLRWLDFNAMLPIPLLSILLYYLLKREITYESPYRKTALFVILNLMLISGIYFFGAGSGDHEVTNYLNTRVCDRGQIDSPLCNIIKYNDDAFSHYVYYLGFILMNVALMLLEFKLPRKDAIKRKDVFLIALNGGFIGLGVFANLAFEEIGLDLYFFGSMMVLALYILWAKKWRNLPITLYFAIAYTIGVVGTIVYKSLSGTF